MVTSWSREVPFAPSLAERRELVLAYLGQVVNGVLTDVPDKIRTSHNAWCQHSFCYNHPVSVMRSSICVMSSIAPFCYNHPAAPPHSMEHPITRMSILSH